MVTTVANLKPEMQCWWHGKIFSVEWITLAIDTGNGRLVTISLVHYMPRKECCIVTLDSTTKIIVLTAHEVRG